MKAVVEASVVGNMSDTNIVLLEGLPPNQQTVVKVKIGKTQVLHSSQMWKTKDKNSGTMSVQLVQVNWSSLLLLLELIFFRDCLCFL